MYKKINIVINFLFIVILLFLAYKYNQIYDYNFTAKEKVRLLNNATDNFSDFGFVICIISLIWTNVLVIKTKQLFWFVMPFLFSVIVSVGMSWQLESIFIFKKQNELWEGSFSLSGLFAIVLILFALIVLGINYFILRRSLNSQTK